MKITNYFEANGISNTQIENVSNVKIGCSKHPGVTKEGSIINKFPFELWSNKKTPDKYIKAMKLLTIDNMTNSKYLSISLNDCILIVTCKMVDKK